MSTKKIFGRLAKRTLISILFVSLSFIVGESFAQHNNDTDAERKKYEFELAKSWSFGFENYKNKQYESAVKHFWQLARTDTINKFPKVYRYLGDSYLKLEQPDSAQFVFEKGLEKYPEDAHLHRMVGFLKAQREQIDEAISEYQRVVELEPESKDDWKQLAALYVRADLVEEAIEAYDKVLQLDPDDIEAQKNKTALIASTGDIDAVIEEKEKIRTQDSTNAQVRYDLGKLYFDQGEFEKSIERFKEFLQLSPNDVGAMEYIANSYQRVEKYRQAIEEFKKILETDPQNKRALAEISRSYRGLGNFTAARTYANRALAVDNAYGLAWIALGEVYEAAAERCVNKKDGKVEFNDKLVYKLAYDQYERAKRDLEYRPEAERHISFLQGVLPTKEDMFMHKDQKKPQGECYTWIN